MAVVAPPLQSKLDSWKPSSTAAPSAKPTGQMTEIMPYQYSPAPNGGGAAVPSSGYMPADYSSIPPSGFPQDPHLSPKKRSDPLSKNLNMKLKRSLSTPVTSQQPAMSHSQGSQQDHSLAEKRRNKLGYHRTSVACGHCRRRKIRCIPSQADVQRRCVNCIRLKKECSFYPVDQQPPSDPRKMSASRNSVGLPPPKTAFSVRVLENGPVTLDVHGTPAGGRPLTKPSHQNMAPPGMKIAGMDAYSPDSKMPSSASRRSFDYGHGEIATWMSDARSSPGLSKPGDPNAPWRSYSQESPVTPAFSPYTPHASGPSATWTSQAESTSRDDVGWSYPPPRSLSFGADSINGQQAQYPSISQITGGLSNRSYERKGGSMSDVYQTPITTTIPGVDSISGTSLDHRVSVSSAVTATQGYGGWQQSYPYSKAGETSDAYVGWTDHSAVTSAEGHSTSSSMYYSGR